MDLKPTLILYSHKEYNKLVTNLIHQRDIIQTLRGYITASLCVNDECVCVVITLYSTPYVLQCGQHTHSFPLTKAC